MDYLPIFVDLKGRKAVVVGGGEVAARKVSLLARAGARVSVIAPQTTARLYRESRAGRLIHHARTFHPGDLEQAELVVAATGSTEVNRAVAEAARERRLPVNVVDCARLSSFIMPAIIDRSPLLVAVSSGGAAPMLARYLRARLETLIPAGLGRAARFLGGLRATVKARLPGIAERRAFWERLLESPALENACNGKEAAARAIAHQTLEDGCHLRPGEVYLVGAGPGDPELLTLRALRLLQQADVIVHDRLVPPAVLALARREARLIDVGKSKSRHVVSQQNINRMLIRLARQGLRVARLKGGDPFIFGRGGEELQALCAAGVAAHVVPGVTAALGCAAAAGIPLTHRDCAQACVLVTGHGRDGRLDLNWAALVQPRQTLVFYMGLSSLEGLCHGLMAHGMAASTPAALIERGSTPEQRLWRTQLAGLAATAQEQGVGSPALVIVGEVVQFELSQNRPEERTSWWFSACGV